MRRRAGAELPQRKVHTRNHYVGEQLAERRGAVARAGDAALERGDVLAECAVVQPLLFGDELPLRADAEVVAKL